MGAKIAQPPAKPLFRRLLHWLAIAGIVLLAVALLLLWLVRETGNAAPPFDERPPPDGELGYPYALVPGDPRLDFPAAEGRQLDMDSDTWFLEGILVGHQTGRRFAFIVVFYVSRIYGFLPFNFYSLTLYDLDNPEYGTFTQYDFGRMQASTGYLDLAIPLENEVASWTTKINNDGYLMPYVYRVNLPGVDQHGRNMRLRADVRIEHPPVAVGADEYNGLITVLKQENTYSYFQTGVRFNGVLSWGDYSESVSGRLGHMDRQMFPRFSGVHNSRDGRDLSHEWRTFFLSNGMDFSSWRQFDRTDRNAEYSYGGATIYYPSQGARYAGDLVYENLSYIRTENHPVEPLLPPRSDVLYFPDRHRISSASLDLDLLVEPIVEAPLLAFPVEYMHGPVLINGTHEGDPISGIGSFELTLHLYRDFELVTVLADSVRHLPAEAILPATIPIEKILGNIEQVGNAIDSDDTATARSTADGTVRKALMTLAEPYRGNMLQILDDLIAVL